MMVRSAVHGSAAAAVYAKSLGWLLLLLFLVVSPAVLLCTAMRGVADWYRVEGFEELAEGFEAATGMSAAWNGSAVGAGSGSGESCAVAAPFLRFDSFCVQSWLRLPRPSPPAQEWEAWVPEPGVGNLLVGVEPQGFRTVWVSDPGSLPTKYMVEADVVLTVRLNPSGMFNVRFADRGSFVIDGDRIFIDVKPQRDSFARSVHNSSANCTYEVGWLKPTYFRSYSEFVRHADNRSGVRATDFSYWEGPGPRDPGLPDYYTVVFRAWGKEFAAAKLFVGQAYSDGFEFGPLESVPGSGSGQDQSQGQGSAGNATLPQPGYAPYVPSFKEFLVRGDARKNYSSGEVFANMTVGVWSLGNLRAQWGDRVEVRQLQLQRVAQVQVQGQVQVRTEIENVTAYCVDLYLERETGVSRVVNTCVSRSYVLGPLSETRYSSYECYRDGEVFWKDASLPDYYLLVVRVGGVEAAAVKIFVNYGWLRCAPWEGAVSEGGGD